MNTLKQEKFDTILLFYSESFFVDNTTRAGGNAELKNIQERFGHLKSHQIINYKEEHTLQKNTVDVELQVVYDSIIVKERVGLELSNKVIKIKSHHIERFDPN